MTHKNEKLDSPSGNKWLKVVSDCIQVSFPVLIFTKWPLEVTSCSRIRLVFPHSLLLLLLRISKNITRKLNRIKNVIPFILINEKKFYQWLIVKSIFSVGDGKNQQIENVATRKYQPIIWNKLTLPVSSHPHREILTKIIFYTNAFSRYSWFWIIECRQRCQKLSNRCWSYPMQHNEIP